MADMIRFTPLTEADLRQLGHWLGLPHVTAWWGDPDVEIATITEDLATPLMEQFVFHVEGRPTGYIQSFDPLDWPNQPFGDIDRGTRAADMFLGEPDFLGRGYGSRVLRSFVDGLFAKGVPRAFIDPNPANARAIRAYEKAGFRAYGRCETGEWAPALLMSRPNDLSNRADAT